MEGTGPRDRGETEEPGASRPAGTWLREAGKAIGCFVLALIVLGIAIVVGVFDIFV